MPIEARKTTLPGALLLQPRVFPDDRGFFCETYRANELADVGITESFVQDNHSRSTRGVLRGLHFAIGDGILEARALRARAHLGRDRRPARGVPDLRTLGGATS